MAKVTVSEADRQVATTFLRFLCEKTLLSDWDEEAWFPTIESLSGNIAEARETGRQAGLREGIFRLRSQLSADRVYEESFPLLSETRTRIANGCSAIEVAIKNLELLTATDATPPGEGD